MKTNGSILIQLHGNETKICQVFYNLAKRIFLNLHLSVLATLGTEHISSHYRML